MKEDSILAVSINIMKMVMDLVNNFTNIFGSLK